MNRAFFHKIREILAGVLCRKGKERTGAGIGTGRGDIPWGRRCLPMFPPVIYLLLHSLFFSLRLSGGGGSFPRPLKAAQEREYLERWAQGDLEARNALVEHNLRLVAHIAKKG